ncbi:MAG TPA: hypothetical protein VIM55_11220 [Mucilaginibacter sp.]
MSLKIRFTPEAGETFDALVFQLKQRWGDSFVLKLETKILKSLETISNAPYLYPVIEEISGMRKCILHKNCSMLYKVTAVEIVVVCFWDNRQNPLL